VRRKEWTIADSQILHCVALQLVQLEVPLRTSLRFSRTKDLGVWILLRSLGGKIQNPEGLAHVCTRLHPNIGWKSLGSYLITPVRILLFFSGDEL